MSSPSYQLTFPARRSYPPTLEFPMPSLIRQPIFSLPLPALSTDCPLSPSVRLVPPYAVRNRCPRRCCQMSPDTPPSAPVLPHPDCSHSVHLPKFDCNLFSEVSRVCRTHDPSGQGLFLARFFSSDVVIWCPCAHPASFHRWRQLRRCAYHLHRHTTLQPQLSIDLLDSEFQLESNSHAKRPLANLHAAPLLVRQIPPMTLHRLSSHRLRRLPIALRPRPQSTDSRPTASLPRSRLRLPLHHATARTLSVY